MLIYSIIIIMIDMNTYSLNSRKIRRLNNVDENDFEIPKFNEYTVFATKNYRQQR